MAQASVINFTAVIYTQECVNCGVPFGMPRSLDESFRQSGKSFCCPNGHWQSYSETVEVKLRKELERREAELLREKNTSEFWRTQKQEAERRVSAQKAVTTKLKKRISHGVCPCCHRTFKQLAAHIAMQHPEYAKPDGEATDSQPSKG
jgi:hypothetical protein